MLALFNNIFDRNILSVDEYIYNCYSEKYDFLYKLKDVFMNLKMSHRGIPDVPYLHEIISEDNIKKYSYDKK